MLSWRLVAERDVRRATSNVDKLSNALVVLCCVEDEVSMRLR